MTKMLHILRFQLPVYEFVLLFCFIGLNTEHFWIFTQNKPTLKLLRNMCYLQLFFDFFFFSGYIDMNFLYCIYCLCVCVCLRLYMRIPLSVSVLARQRASSLYEHDPGYRAPIVRCGMGCLPGSQSVGCCLKRNGAATHRPTGVTEGTGGGGGGEFFPPFTHTPSYLFTFFSSSFLTHSSRKTFELFFVLY